MVVSSCSLVVECDVVVVDSVVVVDVVVVVATVVVLAVVEEPSLSLSLQQKWSLDLLQLIILQIPDFPGFLLIPNKDVLGL